jgi:hypothetical protein
VDDMAEVHDWDHKTCQDGMRRSEKNKRGLTSMIGVLIAQVSVTQGRLEVKRFKV